MRLPELLIALAVLIIGVGFRRAFLHPAPNHGSVKTALSAWLVLLVAGFLIWGLARHSNVRPVTLKVLPESVRLS